MSDGSAARLIGDALDLRNRLKLIWAAALAGQVPAYQPATSPPPPRHRQPGRLGGRPTRPLVGMLSWGRLQTLLEATIIQADPVGAEQQAAAAAQERFVRLGHNPSMG